MASLKDDIKKESKKAVPSPVQPYEDKRDRATATGGSSSRSGGSSGISWSDYKKYENDYDTWQKTGKHTDDFGSWGTQAGLNTWRQIRDRKSNGTRAALIGDRYYAMDGATFNRYEDDYNTWRQTGKHSDGFGSWATQDALDTWRTIRDYNNGISSGKNPSMELQDTINGLDPEVLSAMQEGYRASWKYGDDDEDRERQAAGMMPKNKEKFYEGGSEFDNWLYGQGLPSTQGDYFQQLYQQYAEEVEQRRKQAQAEAEKAAEDAPTQEEMRELIGERQMPEPTPLPNLNPTAPGESRMPEAEAYPRYLMGEEGEDDILSRIVPYAGERVTLPNTEPGTAERTPIGTATPGEAERVTLAGSGRNVGPQVRRDRQGPIRALDPNAAEEEDEEPYSLGGFSDEAELRGLVAEGTKQGMSAEEILDFILGDGEIEMTPEERTQFEQELEQYALEEQHSTSGQPFKTDRQRQLWIDWRAGELEKQMLAEAEAGDDQDRKVREQRWMQDEAWEPTVDMFVSKMLDGWTREELDQDYPTELDQVALDYVFGTTREAELTDERREQIKEEARAQAEAEADERDNPRAKAYEGNPFEGMSDEEIEALGERFERAAAGMVIEPDMLEEEPELLVTLRKAGRKDENAAEAAKVVQYMHGIGISPRLVSWLNGDLLSRAENTDENRYLSAAIMTESERAMFERMAAVDPAEAMKYYNGILPKLDARIKAAREARADSMGPVAGTLLTLAHELSGAGAVEGLAALGKNIEGVLGLGEGVRPNDPLFRTGTVDSRVIGNTSNYLSEKYGEGWGWLYENGVGIAKNTIRNMTYGELGLVMMGFDVAGKEIQQVIDNGGTQGQAFALGSIAAFAEYITEKVSFEGLMNMKADGTLLGTLSSLGKQMFSEGSEELGSFIINTVGDALVMGDESHIAELYNGFLSENGGDKGGAFWHTVLELAKEGGLDFVGGAFSGGVMGGGTLALDYYMTGRNSTTRRGPISRIVAGAKATQAYESALTEGRAITGAAVAKANVDMARIGMSDSESDRINGMLQDLAHQPEGWVTAQTKNSIAEFQQMVHSKSLESDADRAKNTQLATEAKGRLERMLGDLAGLQEEARAALAEHDLTKHAELLRKINGAMQAYTESYANEEAKAQTRDAESAVRADARQNDVSAAADHVQETMPGTEELQDRMIAEADGTPEAAPAPVPAQEQGLGTVGEERREIEADRTEAEAAGQEAATPDNGIAEPSASDSGIQIDPDDGLPTTGMKLDQNKQYSPEELQTYEEYRRSVDPIIVQKAKKILSGQMTSDQYYAQPIGTVSKKFCDYVKKNYGFDVTGFRHRIAWDAFVHIDSGHGENGDSNHSMADLNDIGRLPYILENFDVIEPGTDKKTGLQGYSWHYSDKNNSPAPKVLLKKKIDSTYVVCEAVPDSAKKTIWIITAYTENGDPLVPNTASAALDSTAQPVPSVSPTTIIANSGADVNQDNTLGNTQYVGTEETNGAENTVFPAQPDAGTAEAGTESGDLAGERAGEGVPGYTAQEGNGSDASGVGQAAERSLAEPGTEAAETEIAQEPATQEQESDLRRIEQDLVSKGRPVAEGSIRVAQAVRSQVRSALDMLSSITGMGRTVVIESDDANVPNGATIRGTDRTYAKNGGNVIFNASHEHAHKMPAVINAVRGLIENGKVPSSVFDAYMSYRQAKNAIDVDTAGGQTEFACDVFGAFMLNAIDGDAHGLDMLKKLGLSEGDLGVLKDAVYEALTDNPETEYTDTGDGNLFDAVRGDGGKYGDVDYSFVGLDENGKRIYKTNFPDGTSHEIKEERARKLIQDVWAKKPITFTFIEDGVEKTITAKFDPTYYPNHPYRKDNRDDPLSRTDVGKLSAGNTYGNHGDQRRTADLVDDWYDIILNSHYDGHELDRGGGNASHDFIKMWRYFTTDLIYEAEDGERVPMHFAVNVKETSDGHYFYSIGGKVKKNPADTESAGYSAERAETFDAPPSGDLIVIDADGTVKQENSVDYSSDGIGLDEESTTDQTGPQDVSTLDEQIPIYDVEPNGNNGESWMQEGEAETEGEPIPAGPEELNPEIPTMDEISGMENDAERAQPIPLSDEELAAEAEIAGDEETNRSRQESVDRAVNRAERREQQLRTAHRLYQRGMTALNYFEECRSTGATYDFEVARQLNGMRLRNGLDVGGRINEPAFRTILDRSDHFRPQHALPTTLSSPIRVFENVAGKYSGRNSNEENARIYNDRKTLTDTYYEYGNKQMSDRTTYVAESRAKVLEAWEGHGKTSPFDSAAVQLLGEGVCTEDQLANAVHDGKHMVVEGMDGVFVFEIAGHGKNKAMRLKAFSDSQKTYVYPSGGIFGAKSTQQPVGIDGTLIVDRDGGGVRVSDANGTVIADIAAGNGQGLNLEAVTATKDALRTYYDQAFEQINQIRVENGYKPIGHIENYFPHIGRQETGMAGFAQFLQASTLPTSINGLTKNFKPGQPWASFLLQRLGGQTEYDAIRGFDGYVEGAGDQIYKTPVIQRLRQLENGLRKHATRSDTRNSAFVDWLHEYANQFANKKADLDRDAEGYFGREIYQLTQKWASAFSGASVAGNVGSGLSNMVSWMTGAAHLDPRRSLEAAGHQIAQGLSTGYDEEKGYDGFIHKIPYLNRAFGDSENIRVFGEGKAKTVQGKLLYGFFGMVDRFAKESMGRAYYDSCMAKGMSEEEAIKRTDNFLIKNFADRGTGQAARLFNSKWLKPIGQFQLEVLNQMFHFRDIDSEAFENRLEGVMKELGETDPEKIDWDAVGEKLYAGKIPGLGAGGEEIGKKMAYLLLLSLWGAFTRGVLGRDQSWNVVGTATDIGRAIGNIPEDERSFGSVAGAVGQGLGKMAEDNLPFSSLFFSDSGRIPMLGSISTLTNAGKAIASGEGYATPEDRAVAIAKAPLAFIPGGGQISKAARGALALQRGGQFNASGKKLQYPTPATPGNVAKGLIFGPSSMAPEGYDYQHDALTENKTKTWRGLVEEGTDPRQAYEILSGKKPVEEYTDSDYDIAGGTLGDKKSGQYGELKDAGFDNATAYKAASGMKGSSNAEKFGSLASVIGPDTTDEQFDILTEIMGVGTGKSKDNYDPSMGPWQDFVAEKIEGRLEQIDPDSEEAEKLNAYFEALGL